MNLGLAILIIPLIAVLLSFCVRKNQKALEVIAFMGSVVEAVLAYLIAVKVGDGGTYVTSKYYASDPLDALLRLIIVTVGFFTTWYSIGYFRREVQKKIIGMHRVFQYYLLLHLFMFAMFLAIGTTNPTLMWIAIEGTTLATAFLISFYNKPSAMEAAWKYLVINSVGLLLGFLGTILFLKGISNGSELETWQELIKNAVNMDPTVAKIAFVFVFVGYGTKVGFVPMHTWKPDTYSKAPTPIVALFSGALLNTALLAILRFKMVATSAVGAEFPNSLFLFFGIITVIVAGFIMFTQENYKRLLAWSSIEHAGVMALGFGFGGRLGVFAALLQMIYHALAKSLLFSAVGNIFLKYSSTKMARVRGTLRVIPMTTVIFIVGFLAVTGMPPFGIFKSELYIVLAGITNHPIIASILVLSLAFAFLGFFKQVSRVVFGEVPKGIEKGERDLWTIMPPLVLLIIFVILGFYFPPVVDQLIEKSILLLE